MALLREIAAGLLVLSFVATPTPAAPAEILGTIVIAEGASNWGTSVAAGTTVFSGDKLSTSDTGGLQVRTAAARLQLSKASTAIVSETEGTPTGTLLRGGAAFSTAHAKAFALNISSAVIRPKSDDPTVGEAALLTEKQFVIKCTRGALTISVGDDTRIIPEGSAYRVVLDAALSSDAQDQPPPRGAGAEGTSHGRHRAGAFSWYAVGAIAAGVVTVLAVQEALESPDRP